MFYCVQTIDVNSHIEIQWELIPAPTVAIRCIPDCFDDKEKAKLFDRAMNLLSGLKTSEDQIVIGGYLITLAPVKCRCDKCEGK